jgi:hypothetical protein
MAADLKELERIAEVEQLSDEEIRRKYLLPEAIQHFKDKYPAGCWEQDDEPRGDEIPYDPE